MGEVKSCVICGQKADYNGDILGVSGGVYRCEQCGMFLVESDFEGEYLFNPRYKHSLNLRCCMYHFLHQQSKLLDEKTIVEFKYGHEPHGFDDKNLLYYIPHDTLINMYPQTLDEKIKMVIINLGDKLKFPGSAIFIPKDDFASELNPILLFIDDTYDKSTFADQCKGILDILMSWGYLKTDGLRYDLSARGWTQYQELTKVNRRQAFIAMWFASEMTEAQKIIKAAIDNKGYFPQIITDKQYNGAIVPEILYEIRNSLFVVADFTGARGGVYYEAGYAYALGKPVIMTCREDWFDEKKHPGNIHFDIKQENFIIWINEADLHAKLEERIRVTMGDMSTF
ncbi:MAG: hypothetical protein VB120_08610 [Lachnospiraceae bacterium]|nr:hypothetical protein [Lachnospiraceae bacterium]